MNRESVTHGPAFDRLLSAIEQHGFKVTKRSPTSARAQCPGHNGDGPNLSILSTETRVNATCHSAGCDTLQVLEAVGLTAADRYHQPRTSYTYDNLEGLTLRTVTRTASKQFPQQINAPEVILYRLSEVVEAVKAGTTIYLVEGEEDVHAAEAFGLVATTAPQGARSFKQVDTTPLTGATVVAVVDKDRDGQEGWATQVEEKVRPVARSLRFVQAAKGKDLSDHLTAEHTIEELVPLDAPDAPPSTWAPADLTAILNGTYEAPQPALMARTDGVCLLYAGLTHSFHGESESCKSLIAQSVAVDVLNNGGRVLYLDFESDKASVALRLVELGADKAEILRGFDYLHPEVDMRDSAADAAAWRSLLGNTYDLAVVDGVTASLGLFGGATKDNDNVTAWARLVPDAIARHTGAAVVSVDHVTKDPETRGRFAIGGQAKMAAITGAAYVVEVKEPPGRGLRGVVALRLAKDRPGYLRAQSGEFRARDRTQAAADVVVDSTGHGPTVITVKKPDTTEGDFRPTLLMERASRAIETNPGISKNAAEKEVGGKAGAVRQAIATLIQEGYLKQERGARGSHVLHSLKPYRQGATDDPAQLVPDPGTRSPRPDTTSTSSLPRGRDEGRGQFTSSGTSWDELGRAGESQPSKPQRTIADDLEALGGTCPACGSFICRCDTSTAEEVA